MNNLSRNNHNLSHYYKTVRRIPVLTYFSPSSYDYNVIQNRSTSRRYHHVLSTSHIISKQNILIKDVRNNILNQRRFFSDNLLGYSPMSRDVVTPNRKKTQQKKKDGEEAPKGPIIGVDSNTAGGGVWAQTSAKRDKIVELKSEMTEGITKLDDMALPLERLDLELADGLRALCVAQDQGLDVGTEKYEEEFRSFINGHTGENQHFNKQELEKYLNAVIDKIDSYFIPKISENDNSTDSESKSPASFLCHVRDFMIDTPSPSYSPTTKLLMLPATAHDVPTLLDHKFSAAERTQNEIMSESFQKAFLLYKYLLIKHTSKNIIDSWDVLTRITDGDLDRAAIRQEEPRAVTTLSKSKINDLLFTFLTSFSSDNIDSVEETTESDEVEAEAENLSQCENIVGKYWALLDHDDDGLLDQEEMDEVIAKTIQSYELALRELFQLSVEAHPVTVPLSDNLHINPAISTNNSNEKMGWRKRRKETRTKKKLLQIFDKTIKRHFEMQVETPHRLRCIYAWVDKAHQDGRIDSVLVDSEVSDSDNAIGKVFLGKKRHVELQPKISLEEFRSEQQVHFEHLDNIGEEILASFKEDLLVVQGKRRQNQELKRECIAFLAVVFALDFGISFL